MSLSWLSIVSLLNLKLAGKPGISIEHPIPADFRMVTADDYTGNNTALYAICDEEKFRNEIDCYITRRNLNSNNDSESFIGESCHLDLVLPRLKQIDRKSLQIQQFDISSDVLFTWNEPSIDLQRMSKNITILKMNDCTIKHLSYHYFKKIPSETLLVSNVVVYLDGFDVIISDKDQCMPLNRCRISFNRNGDQIGSPKPFSTSISVTRTESVSNYLNSTVGFFVSPAADFRPHKFVADYVSVSGNMIQLNTGYRDRISTTQLITSTAHRMFTICGTVAEIFHCRQFNIGNGNPRIKSSLSGFKNTRAVHNLDKGGFLLVSLQCSEGSQWTCGSYNVTKINMGVNQMLIPKQLPLKLECSGRLDRVKISSGEDSHNICFRFLCILEKQDDFGEKVGTSLNVFESCVDKTSI
ncbi:hypothetical protein QAD02_000294 [Eretmocerus hayati]|uniref:Uncharacterized protein n=1 Tax=Eretmocerus hayati TaxID=131215 RepID=A0ACC2NCZ9_9HYME|nr:hypothetical protein QAD02_000294 [Eretmocerus hayati]